MQSEGRQRRSLHWMSIGQLLQQRTPEEGLAVSQVEVSSSWERWDTAAHCAVLSVAQVICKIIFKRYQTQFLSILIYCVFRMRLQRILGKRRIALRMNQRKKNCWGKPSSNSPMKGQRHRRKCFWGRGRDSEAGNRFFTDRLLMVTLRSTCTYWTCSC